MLKTVLIDLDDTILDFHWAEATALRDTLSELSIPPSADTIARYSAINAQQWQLMEAGTFTRDEILTRRFDLLFQELGVMRSSTLARQIYERRLAIGHRFIPGAPELLEALAPRYGLYLVTNGTAAVQAGRIASAGIAPYFRKIFVSETMGLHKPQPAYFDACFAAIPDCRREETIIIGDSLTSDMQGGRNAGIRTCWFNPRHLCPGQDIQPDFQVSQLTEIPPLLERISND